MLTEVRNATSPGSPVGDRRGDRQRAEARRTREGPVTSKSIDPAVERTPEQRIGRAAVIGGVIGVTAMIPAVFVLGIVAGAGTAGAIGLALFCSFWGGLGLGCMEGAVAGFAKEERREAEAAREVTAAVGGAVRMSREPARR
jgi:hypothetical protein